MTDSPVVSYVRIIPEKYQNLLIDLGSRLSSVSFAIGDATNEIKIGWDNVKKQRPDLAVSDAEIYAAVGSFCGKSARTVREYAAIAAFFPPAVRDEYCILSIDHFRTAMTLGPAWESALEWAVSQADETGGRPATVDRMIAKFAPASEPPAVPPETIENAGPMSSAEVALNTNLARYKLLTSFVENAGKLRTILDGFGFQPERRRAVEDLIGKLLELLSGV